MGCRRGAALETGDHGVKIAFLGCLGRGVVLSGSAVDCFMQDWAVRIVFLHVVEVGRALDEVRALTAGVFGPYRLTMEALC